MAISVQCKNPECSKACRVKDEYAGKAVKCPKCGQRIHVPKPPAAVAAELTPHVVPVHSPTTSNEATPSELTPPAAATLMSILRAIKTEPRWYFDPTRTIPATFRKLHSIDARLLTWTCLASVLIGPLMVAGVLNVYRGVNNWEMGMLLILLPLPAYATGLLFHRFLRTANRYYPALAIFYLPAAFIFNGWFATVPCDLVFGNSGPSGGQSGTPPSVQAAVLLGLLGYRIVLGLAILIGVSRDMKSHHLPKGSFSFGFGVVFVLISVVLGIGVFYQFLTASAHSSYLTDFFIGAIVTCMFSVPGMVLSNRAGRLRKASRVRPPPQPIFVHKPVVPTIRSSIDPAESTAGENEPSPVLSRFRIPKGVLIPALVIEALVILVGLNQLRADPFEVVEIVRASELINPLDGAKLTPTGANDCVLSFRLNGVSTSEAFAAFLELSPPPNTFNATPAVKVPHAFIRMTEVPSPIGGSIDRKYLGFTIPKSESFPKLVVGGKGSIAFRLPASIVARYEVPGPGAPILWLAVLWPILGAAIYGIVCLVRRARKPV